jgi:hypothetical protein
MNRIAHLLDTTPQGRLEQAKTDLAFCGFLDDIGIEDPAIIKIHDTAMKQFARAKREIKEGKNCQ